MMRKKASNGLGNLLMAPTYGRQRGGKDNGPNPTDRAKPGVKDHLLTDGRGVPLSVVVTAANVNDGPMLPALVNNYAVVRPPPSSKQVQHLCLDAAFDNASGHRVVMEENYQGHIAARKGRDESVALHPGGKARRWVVERTHAWHDRFRRLVVNWEKSIESRYAFLCLANALIAYRS
jgi:transposase